MKKMKLMLVDDEERFLTTTQKILSRKGIEAVTATSGATALEILSNTNIHVVILDVKMPGMDGNETLKKIKNRYPLVEVIMLTGHATVESAIDGMKSGAFDFLMKPAEIDELIDKATAAFNKRQDTEEKIRLARFHLSMSSPLDILKGSTNQDE
jgi:DNA-binding NtrC family response regulator